MSYLDEGKPGTLVSIQWAIRDSRKTTKVKGAERALFEAIGLRCNPKTYFSCFPSYRLLAADTGYDESTLRKKAKVLVAKHLIGRKVRKNRSNIFTLNIKLLWKLARAEKAATEEAESAAKFAAYQDESVDQFAQDDVVDPGSGPDEGTPEEPTPAPAASDLTDDDWCFQGDGVTTAEEQDIPQ